MILRIAFILLLLAPVVSQSRANQPTADSLNAPGELHQVHAGFSFSNYPQYHQSNFASVNSGFAAHLIYSYKTNLWVEAKIYHVPGADPFIALKELAAGYTHFFNEVFDTGIIISRLNNLQYPPDPAFNHFTMVNAQFGVDFGHVYTSVIPSWIWQDIGSFFLLINNSRFFSSPQLGRNSGFLTANPGFYFLLGRETWFRELPLLFQQRLRNRGLEHLIPVLSIVEKPFKFQTLTFALPLAWESIPVSIEVEPSFVINLNADAIVRQPEGFFIRVGIFMKIL